MNKMHAVQLFVALILVLPLASLSQDPSDTRLMEQPTISANHVAFIYAGDLWAANRDGSNPRRLTIDEGVESNPMFSPDGQTIAFSGNYDGNTDVFVVPVEGGVPKRLTWHPWADMVRGFTPDGTQVLFGSQREVFTTRHVQLFTVPLDGGYPTKLMIPHAWRASYSPDGQSMAYTPLSEPFTQWKNYRGGRISRIWLMAFDDYSVVEIPQPDGGCNDTDPMWVNDDQVFFRSDRDGEFNLYSYSISEQSVTRHTRFRDFPIIKASNNGSHVVFEQAGYLHTFDTQRGSSNKITVGISTDLLELRPRYVRGGRYIRSADISPSAARVVFDYRGDIMTVPAEKGDARNITLSTGTHEKYPSWSPDGKWIAYFSDASGEYALHLKSQDGKGDARSISLPGAGFYADINWSPDSEKLTYVDNSRTLYLLDVETGTSSKIDADEYYFPGVFRNLHGDWSGDSKWVVYSKIIETNYEQVFLYSLENGTSHPVSDGMSNASSPVFDPEGRYLYFFASTDAGPVINWFDQSNQDMNMTNSIYLATLDRETISPFAKESDEQEVEEEAPAEETDDEGPDAPEEEVDVDEVDDDSWTIDLDGMSNRIVDVPVRPGFYRGLGTDKKGNILYIADAYNFTGPSKLHMYNMTDREDKELFDVNTYVTTASRDKMLFFSNNRWGIVASGQKPAPGKGMINTSNLQVKIDPVSEWQNIFDEAWRINRDYFYDPGMHGANWPAMKDKYRQFLPHLSCRNDLNRVITWMCSEVAVGHHRLQGGGEQLNTPDRVPGGLLGADFDINNNRYQLEKIYGGLNWTPNLRSPLTEPGVNATEGDYILAVNGTDLTANQNIYSLFEATANKIVELTIGPNPNYTDSRDVKVVPLNSEYNLRNRDWVEGNVKKVTEATNGQVAYVYVPNTAGAGHQYFKRYFFPQADRKAIIVDERFNGGGQIADYYIDILMRPYQSHWNFRYGRDLKTPSASIQGPKVMIIDETAGSGGDMLPWMFRKFNVGTLVGKRTWGGLVGVLGFPEFIDGASVTAPNVGIWTEDGFIVENVGVPPDVEVEQWPADINNGRDPQLERAIQIALEQLRQNPPQQPRRPAYPKRARGR